MMRSDYSIAIGRPEDVPFLASIEREAAQLLRGHAPAAVLEETLSHAVLLEAQAAGRLWVALARDTPVGFAVIEMLAADLPHLKEIDVHPEHGRRGVGTALVQAVCAWTQRSGHAGVTLTTLRDVPWNMPFYARLGFEEVPREQRTPEIEAIVADETSRGLDPDRRVVMRYRVRTE
jgi:GNAT superfamily N-acetyltransferase